MNRIPYLAISTALPLAATAASAHDPKLHEQNAQKPDCAAMKNMDMSKMDMNDPVMKAMHEKCMPAAADHAHDHGTPAKPAQPQAKPDPHGGH